MVACTWIAGWESVGVHRALTAQTAAFSRQTRGWRTGPPDAENRHNPQNLLNWLQACVRYEPPGHAARRGDCPRFWLQGGRMDSSRLRRVRKGSRWRRIVASGLLTGLLGWGLAWGEESPQQVLNPFGMKAKP